MSNTIDAIKNLSLEEKRNNNFLHLTVNENQLSKTASRYLSSKLSERYYFGAGKDGIVDFQEYTFVGMPQVEALVSKAENALKEMTGAQVANLGCFSGLHAMMCAILTTTSPGDTVMSLPFKDGGHGATKGVIENVGRKHVFAAFDLKKLQFNIEETAKIFKESHAKVLYIDVSVHINSIDIRGLRKALGPEALIIFDASHSFGLILGGLFPSPLAEGADVVCSNTHKTFAGPQRGIIVFKDPELGKKADLLIKTVFTSSVHTGPLIALCISILEYQEFGKEYAGQVVKNSRALAEAFACMGHELRKTSAGTYSDNEQVHLFIDNLGDRLSLYQRLVKNNISTNFMRVLGGRPFARIGVQEITRRGMKEKDMQAVAELFDQAIKGKNVKSKVIKFNDKFTEIKYSFD